MPRPLHLRLGREREDRGSTLHLATTARFYVTIKKKIEFRQIDDITRLYVFATVLYLRKRDQSPEFSPLLTLYKTYFARPISRLSLQLCRVNGRYIEVIYSFTQQNLSALSAITIRDHFHSRVPLDSLYHYWNIIYNEIKKHFTTLEIYLSRLTFRLEWRHQTIRLLRFNCTV